MEILLVEDNPGDVRLAQEAFSYPNSPIKLHVVCDGETAMAFLRKEGSHREAPRPHVILLDLDLPKMGGLEVLAQIKTDKLLKAIPTIVLSTSDVESDIRSAYENYANCYFTKPAEWDAFGTIVKHVNDVWLGIARLPVVQGAL
jgi:chemotaxis family two-component system response regulator Rcp1